MLNAKTIDGLETAGEDEDALSNACAELMCAFWLSDSGSELCPRVPASRVGEGEAVERERESGGVHGDELPRSLDASVYEEGSGISAG